MATGSIRKHACKTSGLRNLTYARNAVNGFGVTGKWSARIGGSLHNPDAIDGDEEPWYTEKWYTEDLKNALEGAEIEITEENLEKLRAGCRNIFDDKSERYEMLLDKVRELFKEG